LTPRRSAVGNAISFDIDMLAFQRFSIAADIAQWPYPSRPCQAGI
jgi:hypothetical protein